MPETLKEHCIRRLYGLKQQRRPFEADWHEIAGYCLPARSRFLSKDANKGRRSNRRLNNSAGIFAFRTLQGGMTSGLSSPSRPWFAITLYDDALMEDPQVKKWLGDVEQRMYAFFAHINFYEASKTGYLEVGAFGTDACVMLEHDKEGAVCHALTAGEYWIGMNTALQPGSLYRDAGMTVKQAVDDLGYNNLSTRIRHLYDRSCYEEVCPFYHAIEENPDYEEGKLGAQGKQWRSVWWDESDQSESSVIKVSGYEEQPFWAPRWDTTGADSYGQGPGHDALPDLRELQLQTKRKAEATDLLVWPEKIVSAKVKLKNQPKSIVSTDVMDAAKAVTIPYQVPYQAVEEIRKDMVDLQGAISRAAFADLFMAITGMPGVQPRTVEEIAARNEEKLTQLGPVIERVNGEKLTVAIERTFGIMQRRGLLPPAPQQVQRSPDLKIEFVSILTQMQRMIGLGQIERVTQFVGGLAGMYPSARFKLDPFGIVDDYAKRAGMPAKLIRSSEDAQKDSDAEQQAQQQQQMAEMAAKVGKPAKDITDAAALAASMPVAGSPAIPQLTGLQ